MGMKTETYKFFITFFVFIVVLFLISPLLAEDKDGDVPVGMEILKVGDARVEDFPDLVARIGAQTPGGPVALTVQRGGQERTVDVTLGSQKDEAPTTSTAPSSGVFPFPNPFGR